MLDIFIFAVGLFAVSAALTAILASATSFDANLLPATGSNASLGQDGSAWQRIVVNEGSANNPSYSWSNSVGLGIFKSAANTLDLASNQSSRMTVNSSGNVGIGTSTIPFRLTVADPTHAGSSTGIGISTYYYPGFRFLSTLRGNGGKFVLNDYNDGYGTGSLQSSMLVQGPGAVQFSTGGDNLRMTIDSSGNVGIGTVNPLTYVGPNLDISGNLALKGQIVMSAESNSVCLGDCSSNDGSSVATISFRTHDATRLTVDANGAVNRPNQPWFIAGDNRGWMGCSTGWNEIVFNTVGSGNAGGWYNASTGRFTAPIAGLYDFVASDYTYPATVGYPSAYVHPQFFVNGTWQSGLPDYNIVGFVGGTYNKSIDLVRKIYLNAGDYVSVHYYCSTNMSNIRYGGYSYFAGTLLN